MTEKGRLLLGKILLVAGVVSSLLFLSPIIPVGPEGLLVGCLFFAWGGWVLAGPDLRSRIRRLAALKRSGRARIGTPVTPDPLLPVRILRLAKERNGVLTLSETVIALDVPIGQVEAALRVLLHSGTVMEEYSVSRGHALYRFPEFLPTGNEGTDGP
jgi:hypothetical protein